MNIDELLTKSKSIWKNKSDITDIVIKMGKVFGDICRYARNADKDKPLHTDDEIKKELGNMIFSSIRWCDDLGYDPKECVGLAINCQEKYQKKPNSESGE